MCPALKLQLQRRFSVDCQAQILPLRIYTEWLEWMALRGIDVTNSLDTLVEIFIPPKVLISASDYGWIADAIFVSPLCSMQAGLASPRCLPRTTF